MAVETISKTAQIKSIKYFSFFIFPRLKRVLNLVNERLNKRKSTFCLTMLTGRIVVGLSSFQFMAMVRRGLFYTFLSLYLRVILGLSVTETTLLACLSMIANSVSQSFIWGKISDKYQTRVGLIIIGETIAAVGYTIIYFTHIYMLEAYGPFYAAYTIIIGFTVLEFFWSMSNVGWSALISDVTASHERSKLMSIISSIGGVGQIVGVTVAGILYDWGGEAAGFRNGTLFFFASAIMIASAAVIGIAMRSTRPKGHRIRTPVKNTNLNRNKTSISSYNLRSFYWFLSSLFIVSLGTFSILQILIFYVELDTPIGASSVDIAMIRNSASIAAIITSLFAGPIAEKIGKKRTLGIGFALRVITPLLYIAARGVQQMIIFNSLSGVSMALMNVVGYLVASELIPAERRGKLFGQYNAVNGISFGIAGTVVGGPIADYLISIGVPQAQAYIATFEVAAIISLIGTIIYLIKVRA